MGYYYESDVHVSMTLLERMSDDIHGNLDDTAVIASMSELLHGCVQRHRQRLQLFA